MTLFIFMVVCLIMPMKMLNTQRRVQMVLESASKSMSQYAYIAYRLSQGETDVVKSEKNEDSGALEEILDDGRLFETAVLGIYLREQIQKAAGPGRVENLNFTKLRVEGEGEVIDLNVTYRLKLPFSVFRLDSVPAASRSMRRGWIGSDGGRRELGRGDAELTEEDFVYVGNNMGRYHRSRDCHYISNKITSVSPGAIADKLSSSGTHYKPCSVCGKKGMIGTQVYIMPNGAYYHGNKNCSSLAFYVRQVPLSEVEHLGECSYCGGVKGIK